MITLVDVSQILIGALYVGAKNGNLNFSRVRVDVVRRLCAIHRQYRRFGPLVICGEDKVSWRHAIFKNYKLARVMKRQGDEFWEDTYQFKSDFIEEMELYAPWKVVRVKYAEADDVVATLTMAYGKPEKPVAIISGDHDFVQLHRFGAVQFRPEGVSVTEEDELPIWVKVLKGDPGDSIPNVYSPDDWFATAPKGMRQKSITKNMLQSWGVINSAHDMHRVAPDLTTNYIRNRRLVDLTVTPQYIRNQIMKRFAKPAGPNKLLDYARDYRLRGLTEHLGDISSGPETQGALQGAHPSNHR